jgi:hypothetical protein
MAYVIALHFLEHERRQFTAVALHHGSTLILP